MVNDDYDGDVNDDVKDLLINNFNNDGLILDLHDDDGDDDNVHWYDECFWIYFRIHSLVIIIFKADILILIAHRVY